MESEFRPKIRWPIEVNQHQHEGKPILVFRCPLGYSKKPLVLNGVVAPILSVFDGSKTIAEIAEQFRSAGASFEIIAELAKVLDENLFLESPRFEQESKKVRKQFAALERREPALAGLGYSSISTSLIEELGKILQKGQSLAYPLQGGMLGLVSPHIDFRRGSSGYGEAYAGLKNEVHTLYLVFGTAHQYSPLLFHLTKKHFATPLGELTTDIAFVKDLAERYGIERAFEDELLHKQEHSIELQTPFLQLLKPDAKYVPILVGGFYDYVQKNTSPEKDEKYERFVESICEVIQHRVTLGERIGIIAGVDMAHIGQFFGDKEPLTPDTMKRIEERDRQYLESIVLQDKEMMFSHIAEDRDARRICGFPTMYTVIDIYNRLNLQYQAEVFGYHQAVDYESDCAVTFAAAGLYEKLPLV
ncbi:MAG: AmmeMemoRadiSam system protein B [Bdellovibrionales bacterium]|nr:AmmeMemoRadiSam system protein B [Bdellovibrionales bacterium]